MERWDDVEQQKKSFNEKDGCRPAAVNFAMASSEKRWGGGRGRRRKVKKRRDVLPYCPAAAGRRCGEKEEFDWKEMAATVHSLTVATRRKEGKEGEKRGVMWEEKKGGSN